MMKLYYAPGACSLAVHIALREAGLDFTTERVDLRTHRTEGDVDYYTVNPKGYVPTLELDDGTRLTEVGVLLQYVADRKPGTLAPAPGTMERYRLMEWLNFISTEIHKGFGPLWQPLPPEQRDATLQKLGKRLTFVAQSLAQQDHLTGTNFTIADAYLFTVLNWSGMLKVDLSPWPALQAFHQRVAARPAVRAALIGERLLKEAA